MIQDISPHRYDNAYAAHKISANDTVLAYDKRCILLKKGSDGISYPSFREMDPTLAEGAVYLFSIDKQRYFWLRDGHKELEKSGYSWESIQYLRQAKPKHQAFAGVSGLQLATWYENHRFCGRCAGKLKHSDKERMLYCPDCNNMEYPKISPAVIIAVTHNDRLLLSKYAGREYKKYALLAGFAEIGETIEETVKREVMEEVGLRVSNIRYYKCQPWSFTDTLLFGFYADLEGGEEIKIDEDELSMANWFDRDKIPVEYEDCSLTNEMIIAFKNGLR